MNRPLLAVALLALASLTARAETPAAGAAPAGAAPAGAAPADDRPYRVVDGYKVDAETMEGFRTWRAAACDRCHGAEQQGLVGPSLIDSLKQRSEDEVKRLILEGNQARGMPAFKGVPTVAEHIDELYAYLKGRSDGAITQAKVQPIE